MSCSLGTSNSDTISDIFSTPNFSEILCGSLEWTDYRMRFGADAVGAENSREFTTEGAHLPMMGRHLNAQASTIGDSHDTEIRSGLHQLPLHSGCFDSVAPIQFSDSAVR